jgi:hypothetical protein
VSGDSVTPFDLQPIEMLPIAKEHQSSGVTA